MSSAFHRIDLLAFAQTEEVVSTLKKVVHFLQSKGCDLRCERETAHWIEEVSLSVVETTELGVERDLLVVIGGDGSLLRAARIATQQSVPLIGINRGKLGFLNDIYPDQIETQLGEVLAGRYTIGERFLLEARQSDQLLDIALNDVVLSSARLPHMVEFEIEIEGEFVCSHRADGLIVSTPTGSTAYCLSAGGPILHPQMDAFVLLPMFAHTLGARPIVISGNSEIILRVSRTGPTGARLSCDGIEVADLFAGDHILLKKHPKKVCFIHPPGYHYYESLQSKLGWGKKLTAK